MSLKISFIRAAFGLCTIHVGCLLMACTSKPRQDQAHIRSASPTREELAPPADTFSHVDHVEDLSPSPLQETKEFASLIQREIERYRSLTGHPPVNLGALDAIPPSPDLVGVQRWRRDGWHRPFVYHASGSSTYVLFSTGPDGKRGTADDLEFSKLK